MGKVIVITGHYGSGKTNFSINLALALAQEQPQARITVCDLDIVNPYFRTADHAELFERHGIKLITPLFANTSLDIPALGFDMAGEAAQSDLLILDVGGDEQGAIALGRYADVLVGAQGLEMLYVVNRCRKLTESPQEALELMYEIEQAARLKHTGVVNNSNLGALTDEETLLRSVQYAEDICRVAGLPLRYTAVRSELFDALANKLPCPLKCEVYVKPVWE